MKSSRRALLASLGAAALAGCVAEPGMPAPPESLDTEWAAPAHDPGLSNGTTAPGPTEQVRTLWSVELDASPSAPVVAGETLYVGGSDGVVRAFDARTGETGWNESVGDAAGVPWAHGETLYVPTRGEVVALDASDGTESWRIDTPARRGLVVTDERLYWLASGGPAVAAHALADGSERWRTELADPWEPPLFAGSGSVFVSSGTYDSRFWTLDAASGDLVGGKPRSGADFPAEKCYRDGRVYAVDAFFGNVHATAMTDDARGWSQGVPYGGGVIAASAGADLACYAVGAKEEPNVTALSTSDGRVAWTANPPVSGRPVVAGESVFVPTDNSVRCFDAADGSRRWTLSGAKEIAVVDDLLYATFDGAVRALRAP